MDIKNIRLIREKYLNLLAPAKEYNTIIQSIVNKDEYEPLACIEELEPESDLSFNKEQRQLSEILLDLHAVNNGIVEAKNKIVDIIDDIDYSLATIRDNIKKQSEQVEDLNLLCGTDSLYNAIIPIYVTDFENTSAELLDSKTIGASVISSTAVPYDIISLSGNGYSGNAFVYQDKQLQEPAEDHSDLQFISDSNDITIYEYSRLYARQKDAVITEIINYDDRPAECVLTLSAKESVCQMRLLSPDSDIIVTRLETSDDGIHFYDRLQEPVAINDLSKIYQDAHYIYGSNMLCFPYSSFIRVTLSNNKSTNDIIAMPLSKDTNTIQRLDTIFRKRIAIAGIELYSMQYDTATLVSQEILKEGAVDKVSLFASEYIPDHFSNDVSYIQYSLILNGQEYPIVPANSGREGTRIIKYSEESTSLQEYTELIHETIKTLQVKITIEPHNQKETPYVSNLKICVGKTTGSIYV